MQGEKRSKTKRRFVGDEEYRSALSNRDNQRIMWKVKTKFQRSISPDDLDRCGKIALWNALAKHDDSIKTRTGKSQKFTTSLTRYINWECCRYLRDNKPKNIILTPPKTDNHELRIFMRECLDKIEEGELIDKFYLQNESEEEIASERGKSIEEVRTAISVGLTKLKPILENNHGRDF